MSAWLLWFVLLAYCLLLFGLLFSPLRRFHHEHEVTKLAVFKHQSPQSARPSLRYSTVLYGSASHAIPPMPFVRSLSRGFFTRAMIVLVIYVLGSRSLPHVAIPITPGHYLGPDTTRRLAHHVNRCGHYCTIISWTRNCSARFFVRRGKDFVYVPR